MHLERSLTLKVFVRDNNVSEDFEEEEASTRWPIPGNRTEESLRKTVREKSAREGGGNS
jgi:hypothetical protein